MKFFGSNNVPFRIILKDSIGIFLISGVFGFFAFFLYHHLDHKNWVIPSFVVSTMGTALAIFIGFKNSASYDRYWEARKIWGGIVNQSRFLSQHILNHTDLSGSVKKEVINDIMGWVEYMSGSVNTKNPSIKLDHNVGSQLLFKLGERISENIHSKNASEVGVLRIYNSIENLFELQGKVERIKNTSLPMGYNQFTLIFLIAFSLLLPFALLEPLDDHGIREMVLPISMFVSWAFYVIHRTGESIEQPFDHSENPLHLEGLVRTIKSDLNRMLEMTEKG